MADETQVQTKRTRDMGDIKLFVVNPDKSLVLVPDQPEFDTIAQAHKFARQTNGTYAIVRVSAVFSVAAETFVKSVATPVSL